MTYVRMTPTMAPNSGKGAWILHALLRALEMATPINSNKPKFFHEPTTTDIS